MRPVPGAAVQARSRNGPKGQLSCRRQCSLPPQPASRQHLPSASSLGIGLMAEISAPFGPFRERPSRAAPGTGRILAFFHFSFFKKKGNLEIDF